MNFLAAHANVKLVIIDTLQRIRKDAAGPAKADKGKKPNKKQKEKKLPEKRIKSARP